MSKQHKAIDEVLSYASEPTSMKMALAYYDPKILASIRGDDADKRRRHRDKMMLRHVLGMILAKFLSDLKAGKVSFEG